MGVLLTLGFIPTGLIGGSISVSSSTTTPLKSSSAVSSTLVCFVEIATFGGDSWKFHFNLALAISSGRLDLRTACQECSKNSAHFAQFLLSFLTYVLLSYFIHLHCANIHTPLPFFPILMTFRTCRPGIQLYLVLRKTSRTTTLQVLVVIILRTWLCTLFPQMRSLCTVWGVNTIKTSQLVN